MKNIFKITYSFAIISILSMAVVSCDMDKYPGGSLGTDKVKWDTVDDVQKFRTGVYSLFQSINGGLYSTSADYQSDLFNATIGFGNNGGDLYRWDFTSGQADIEKIWKDNYRCIVNLNNLLTNIDKVKTSDEDEINFIKNTKGETYLMRAICYHNLVIRFAKDYEPSTASKELGLPLIIEYNVEGKPSRSTLEETYKLIKEDITEARKLIVSKGKQDAIYLSQSAADLFEARVNLYMHDYSNAIRLASKLKDSYPLVSTEKQLENLWLNDTGSEIIFKAFSSKDERANEMDSFLNFNVSVKAFSPEFMPSLKVVNLYADSDIRKNVFLRKDIVQSQDERVDELFLLNKYPGNPSLLKKPYEYFNMIKVFRVSEAYLIAAEASFLNGDMAASAKWLNDLKVARGANPINTSGEELFSEIQDEWIREYVGEGMRLDQLKRWHLGLERKNEEVQDTNILIVAPGYSELKVESDDVRFVWEIPVNDLEANTNLVPNWSTK